MDQNAKPSPVILSAKATHEWTIDKEALAHWAQHTFENAQLAHGITKHEIERGFCRYTYDYDKLGILAETMFNSMIDRGLGGGLNDVTLIGSGVDTKLKMTVNTIHASSLIKVLGAPERQDAPLNPSQALEAIKSSFQFKNGITLDGGKLLGALRDLADTQKNMLEEHEKFLKNASREERQEVDDMQKMVQGHIDKKLNPLGIELKDKGSVTEVTFSFDKFLEFAEKHSAPDLGYAVKRNENGTASVIIDYRRLVDMAIAQAQKQVMKIGTQNSVDISTLDMDTVKIIAQTGDLKNIWNGLIAKATDAYIGTFANRQGGLRAAFGTLADQPQLGRGPAGN